MLLGWHTVAPMPGSVPADYFWTQKRRAKWANRIHACRAWQTSPFFSYHCFLLRLEHMDWDGCHSGNRNPTPGEMSLSEDEWHVPDDQPVTDRGTVLDSSWNFHSWKNPLLWTMFKCRKEVRGSNGHSPACVCTQTHVQCRCACIPWNHSSSFLFFFFWSWEQTQGLLLARQGLHHQG